MSQEQPGSLEYASHGRQHGGPVAPGDRLESVSAMFATLKYIFGLVLSAGLFALVIAALWQVHPAIAVFVGVAWFVVMPALDAMARDVRRRRATLVLSYLAQAATLNLPLARMLDAAQRSEGKRTARRLQRLRDLLEDGAPLSTALPIAVPEVSARMVGLLGAAERLGRLPQALGRAVAEHRTPVGRDPSADAFARWYPLLMTLAVGALLMLILVFVMPKFEEIYKDFGLKLPPATRTLVAMGRGAFEYEVVPVVLGLFVAGVLAAALRHTFVGPRGGAGTRIGLVDQVLWRVPIVHALQRDRGLADAFHTIADGLRTGRPLPRAVAEAAQLHVNEVLQTRLARWAAGMETGMRADEAARRAGLPSLVGGMIASGRGGDPAEAAQFLATYYGGRFSRAKELIRAMSVPLLVLLFGAVVLFVIAGMYEPILNLMDHLSVEALRVSR